MAGLLVISLTACQVATPVPAIIPTPSATPTIILTLTPNSTATIQPSVKAYLDAVIEIMYEHSYYRAEADWQKLEEYANLSSIGKKTIEDTYPVIRMLLAELGDKHGYLMAPSDYTNYTGLSLEDNTFPEVELLENGLGYIMLPSFASGDHDVVRAYATNLQAEIAVVDAGNPCGWIVDLRRNGGGNMWAMLAGIGPVLGEGLVGGWDDGKGQVNYWHYENGKALLDEIVIVEINGEPYTLRRPNPPVAVLTDQPTTSSGEAIAIAFRGRPDTRSFGGPTWGLPSAIEGYLLPDNALLGLTIAFFIDRNQQLYNGPIKPDHLIRARTNPIFTNDLVPQPAIDWLLEQPACQGQ